MNIDHGPIGRYLLAFTFAISTNISSFGFEEVSSVTGNPMIVATTEVRPRRSEFDVSVGTGEIIISRWYGYVSKRLSELENGEHDFSGLVQPKAPTISRAQTIVSTLLQPYTPTPSVVPSEEGAVLFVWHKSGWDMEIEVSDLSTYVWAKKRDDDEGWSGSLMDHQHKVSELLEEFARS